MKETCYPLSSRSHPKHGDPERLFCFAEERHREKDDHCVGHLIDLETQSHEVEQLFSLDAYHLLP